MAPLVALDLLIRWERHMLLNAQSRRGIHVAEGYTTYLTHGEGL